MKKFFRKSKKNLLIFLGIIFISFNIFSNNIDVLYDQLKLIVSAPDIGINQLNQNKEVFAAEEKPIVCRKKTEIILPPGISADSGPNEFEIPIGQVTDMTESIAERTMAELQKIIDASILEAAIAGETTDLSGQCGISRCTTNGCYEESCNPYPCNPRPCEADPLTTCYDTCWQSCCRQPACGGQACPNGIDNKSQAVSAQANIASSSLDKIRGILIEWNIKQPVGQWWITCPSALACLNEKQFVEKELLRARSGDYQIAGGGYEHRPPGLEDCVIRPEDMEAVLKGEKTGKYLFSCKEAVAAGVMESDQCYGYNEATAPDRAESYYCCE